MLCDVEMTTIRC